MCCRFKGGHSLFQIKFYAFLLQMLVYERSHGKVDGGHYLRRHFDHGHFRASGMKVLGHFESYEPSAYDDGAAHVVFVEILLHTVGVSYVAQGENAFALDARQRWSYGRSSRRKQQFVVTFSVGAPFGRPYSYGFGRPVDGQNLRLRAYVDVEPFAESFRRLYEEAFALFYHSAYVVGQSAVGIGNVRTFFKHDDVGAFRVSSDAGGCGGSAGHAAYDDIFHNWWFMGLLNCFLNIFRWKRLQRNNFIFNRQSFRWKLIVFNYYLTYCNEKRTGLLKDGPDKE